LAWSTVEDDTVTSLGGYTSSRPAREAEAMFKRRSRNRRGNLAGATSPLDPVNNLGLYSESGSVAEAEVAQTGDSREGEGAWAYKHT